MRTKDTKVILITVVSAIVGIALGVLFRYLEIKTMLWLLGVN